MVRASVKTQLVVVVDTVVWLEIEVVSVTMITNGNQVNILMLRQGTISVKYVLLAMSTFCK